MTFSGLEFGFIPRGLYFYFFLNLKALSFKTMMNEFIQSNFTGVNKPKVNG